MNETSFVGAVERFHQFMFLCRLYSSSKKPWGGSVFWRSEVNDLFWKNMQALTLLLILLTLAFIYPKSNYKRYHLGWGQFRGERHLYC